MRDSCKLNVATAIKGIPWLTKEELPPKITIFPVIKGEIICMQKPQHCRLWFLFHNSELPQLSTTTTLFMLSAMFIYSGERELLNVIIRIELQMVLNLSHIFQINKNKKQNNDKSAKRFTILLK